jgi:CO/xanthine dehydrogenase Mo-binding subunit
VRLATSWVEPGYLEPDASWCEPGGDPASPLANGGAFGGKIASPVGTAARELADRLGRPVRTLFSREDVVRLGPKRPPFAGSAVCRDGRIVVHARFGADSVDVPAPLVYRLTPVVTIGAAPVTGPPVSWAARAAGLAEVTVLREGALDAAGFDRVAHLRDARAESVFLDNVVRVPTTDACAGAHVTIDPATGALGPVEVRVAAGDPLDDVVLRSYAIGAAHMALGWVLTEGIAVDPDTGEVHDLTIRSFGILRAKDTPVIDVTIVDDDGPPCGRASDAVFAAVAASAWNELTRAEGPRPETFPALTTRTARMLRR